ncbi:F-box/LRR-repeat protein At3g59200 [Lathyrus oleraceus]|uniref:F-box/LRR-repeat protein At3g59200 n=1 Tax=Pisum sativum TaxID=3888 RepID=UPI0021D23DF8|nr:F-box/LRR-repeat protein At3g59200-like [Pisum sativum]
MENLLPHPPHSKKRPQSESSIHDLPDEILSHILSFLPTKHAFKTILLSKKWIPICHSRSALHIDDIIVNSAENKIHLVRFVDAFMFSPHSQHLPLKSFSINCRSQQWDAKTDRFTFDKWIEAAKLRRVLRIYLYLLDVPLSPTIFCFKTLVSLTLVKIQPDTLFDSSVDLPSLKSLCLNDVRFHHIDHFMKLLSGCPVLERLSTMFVKVNDRATAKGYFKPLSKLIIAGIVLFEVPFKAVYNVQHLNVSGLGHDLISKETNSFYKDFPVFENLTVLNLCWSNNTQIHDWDELAKSAPTKEDWKYPYHVPQCLLSHLITCNIRDYEAIEADFRFATYILQNARYLQEKQPVTFREMQLLNNQLFYYITLSSFSSTSIDMHDVHYSA